MNDAIDITPAQRKSILALLRQHLPGMAVWAYGSRVKWTARSSSDLDLVAFSTPAQRGQVVALKEAFAEGSLPFRVDFFVWDEVPEKFRRGIEKEHVVLQEAGQLERRADMTSEWPEYKLSDLCDSIDYGYTASARELPIGPRFLRITDITQGHIDWKSVPHCEIESENIADYRLNHGDVVIARTGATTGVSAYITNPPDAVFASYLVRLKIGQKADSRFISYFLKSESFWNYIHGVLGDKSAQPNASASTMTQAKLRLPPLSIQRTATQILSALDDKIELNRRMNETLEAMAQAIFKEFFPYSPEDDLPKTWQAVPINELCELNSWTLGNRDEIERIDYIEISEVSYGNINSIKLYSRGEEPSRARRRLRHGDTVLSTVRPERGAYFLCLNPSATLIASTGFTVVTPKTAPWSFVHAALTRPEVFERLGQLADGGAYPAIRPEVIGNIAVSWPDDFKIVNEYHKVCSPIFERMDHNRAESCTLAAQRDTLLPKLLSGELRVTTLEKSAKEALRWLK